MTGLTAIGNDMWASRRMDRRDLRLAAQRKETRYIVPNELHRRIWLLLSNGFATT